MSYIVQKAVFPKLFPCSEKRLYFRYNNFCDVPVTDDPVHLFQGGALLSNTYFNSISIGKLKKYTQIKQLSFSLRFCGKIRLTWKTKHLQQADITLQEILLQAEYMSTQTIPLEFWPSLQAGMLFFEIHALSDTEIEDFCYETEQAPLRQIKVGVVITHFNRISATLAALDKLKKGLLPYLANNLTICVVDNSQNLPEVSGITIIKNPNLGGAGGFSRGLLYCKEQGISHCLFMDDDASCEIESIQRTLFYLSYSLDPKLAISGAMLREVEPNMQHENGGVFNGLCHSVKCHYNLLSTRDILLNENEERIDYGAWWFFAFPLAYVSHLAFPYFVRGDDISFSLANDFKIITINGIASWQADFAHKAGPLQLYLDQRNHVMHFLHGLVVNGSDKMLLKTSLILFFLNALTYQYESARACTLAIEDVLKGPQFWRDNVDMQNKRQQLLAMTVHEKIKTVPAKLRNIAQKGQPQEFILKKLLRLISLNGHFIPSCFFYQTPVWQNKHYGVRLREIFLRKHAIYYTDNDNLQGVVLTHNKKLFYSYAWLHLKMVWRLWKARKKLSEIYQQSYAELTSESFWQQQFERKK